MKRHEYKIKYVYDELTDSTYAITSSPDLEALGKLIDIARGERTLERFAYECGTTACFFYRIIQQTRSRNLMIKQLRMIFEHAEPGCGITMEELIHANGMIEQDPAAESKRQCSVTKIMNKTEPKNKTSIIHVPRPKMQNEEIITGLYPFAKDGVDKEKENVTYDQFLHDLSVYASNKNKEDLKFLHLKKDTLYQNPEVMKLLVLYRNSLITNMDERLSVIRNYYLNNGELTPTNNSADSYRNKLDQIIFGGAL